MNGELDITGFLNKVLQAVALSPNGRILVSAGIDVAPRLWQLSAGK